MVDFAADRFLRGAPPQVSPAVPQVSPAVLRAGASQGAQSRPGACLLLPHRAAIPVTGSTRRHVVPYRVSRAIG